METDEGRAYVHSGADGALVRELHTEGWQVLTHAQGDRGTREALALWLRDTLDKI